MSCLLIRSSRSRDESGDVHTAAFVYLNGARLCRGQLILAYCAFRSSASLSRLLVWSPSSELFMLHYLCLLLSYVHFVHVLSPWVRRRGPPAPMWTTASLSLLADVQDVLHQRATHAPESTTASLSLVTNVPVDALASASQEVDRRGSNRNAPSINVARSRWRRHQMSTSAD